MKDDSILIRRVLKGDPQAFRELVKAHERLVYHMVSRLIDREEEREDLCQEIFLKVYRNLSRFKHESQLSTWIGSIAYKTTINHLRKHKKYQETGLETVSAQWESLEISAEQFVDRNYVHKYVHQLIEQLPQQYKVVLTLYHLQEMSYTEIGEISGMPEGTVKNYLFRARKFLKEKLETVFRKEELL